ncbi:MAG: tRNA adenosine(34) deaminase TadA [Rhodanobacteraceae bacterium]
MGIGERSRTAPDDAQAAGGEACIDSAGAADDAFWMARALALAEHARTSAGEVPVGALLVLDSEIIGEGWNRNITRNDPSAHAEIETLRDAGTRRRNYRFPGSTLYVTLEPCVMCAGAIIHARIARVVYGADDPKTGAAGSVFDTLISDRHNHRVALTRNVLSAQSAELLRGFFRERRP